MLSKSVAAAVVAIAMTGLSPAPVSAQEPFTLQYASYIGESAAQSRAFEWWAEEVEKRTDGRVKVELFYQGSLLAATDVLRGVADGRAQLGYVANAYHPAELPLSSVVGVPFVTSNAEAQMRTFYELYQRNESFRAEWENQGVHVLFFNPLSENIVGMRDPIDGLGDIEGKSIRGLGYVNQVLEIVGANPVAIAAPEIYEALLRGTLDGYSGFAFEVVTALKLHEVAPHTTTLGTGNYAFTVTPITKSLWDEMPDDIKRIMTEVSVEYMDKVTEFLVETEDDVCAAIKESGGSVRLLPGEDIANVGEMVGDRINQLWIEDATARDVDAAAFFDDYTETLARHEAEVDYVSGVKRCAEAG
ncbi:MAG: C4-dicarboxylate TRAP transporter substrate-binding protein [Rhizobiaceae bacterium]